MSIIPSMSRAQSGSGLGQTIQINTRLRSFVGKPTWLIIIRDLDHGQNIPYLFDFSKGQDSWVIFTYSRNYLIVASRLHIESYQSRYNTYKNIRINNFCHLESQGRILHGESLFVTLSGDLSPNANTYTCHAAQYANANFVVTETHP